MSTPFQNRLVGTVIIAAIAVIFLPDLLDGKKQAYQADFEDIPPAPKVIAPPPQKTLPEENFKALSNGEIDRQQALNDVFEKQKYNQANQQNTAELTSSSTLKVNTLIKEEPFSDSNDGARKAIENNIAAEVKLTAKKLSDTTSVANQETTQQAESNAVKSKLVEVTHSDLKKSVTKSTAQWVVQLGSFRHEKNVNILVDKLTNQNFKVFTKPIKTKNGTLTKVFVGPEANKNTLEKQLGSLKALTGVNGKVARY